MQMRALWLGCVAMAWVACGGEDTPAPLDVDGDAGEEQAEDRGEEEIDDAPPAETDSGEAEQPREQADPGEDTDAGAPAGEVAEAVSAMIGAEGGALASADGRIALEVPAGALPSARQISIHEIPNQAPGHTGKAFRLLPEGVTFAKPVKLTFRYQDEDVAGSAPGMLRVVYRDASGSWHMLRSALLDREAHSVSVETSHFSDWSLVLGAVLLPHQATVKTGQSIQLKVTVCLQAHVEGDGEISVEHGYDCEEQPLLNAFLYGWSVNGKIYGDDVTGVIRSESDPRSGRAMYDAPRQKPAANPVAVSVQYQDTVFGSEILVSHIKVLDDSSKWTGKVTYEVDGSHAFPGESGFVGDITDTFHHKETFEIVAVVGRNGPSTYLTFAQSSDVKRTRKGRRTKQVYSSCQAGAPEILRHDYEYEIDKELSGALVSEYIDGRVYIDAKTGEYHVSIDYEQTPIEGSEKVVDLYREGCFGGKTDGSYTKAISSSEAMPYAPKVEGTIDPDQPLVLKGSYPVKFPNDILGTQGWVTWELTRGEDGK